MKTKFKRILALSLALVTAIALCACSDSGNATTATTLVQGNLDEIYLGKFDPKYLMLVDITEDEANETYLGGLEYEAYVFAHYFNVEYLTDDLKAEIVDLYKEIYSYSKYTVNDATKLDDNTYAVKVQVEPLNIFQLVVDDFDEEMAPFYEKYADTDFSSMTDEEYQAYDAEWTEAIIDLCYEKLADIGYMDERSIVIQVEKDEEGYWVMSGDDFYNFDDIIIYYP